ncbi:MAG TPA: DUF922 domain-containing protein [Gemmatimonadaceae bacterium]|nr:DUF922 domain-containing protein [Gemmatimonadaceae bacterium]
MQSNAARNFKSACIALIGLWLVACGTAMLDAPASPAMGVRLRQDVTQYEVTGNSVPELRASIHTRARLQPDRTGFAGYTRWSLSWTYASSTMGPRGCTPNGVQVELELAVRYPTWADSASADPSVQSEWQRYLAALKAHEANHAAIALRGANRLARELRMMIAPSCGMLQPDGQMRAADIVSAILEENKRYDEATRHGATEGATLASGP